MRFLSVFLFCACGWAQSDPKALEILERVADKYKGLDSLLVTGVATRLVSSERATQVKIQRAYVSRRLIPEGAPFPYIDAAARTRDDPDPAFLIFREVADRVCTAKLLPEETFAIGGRTRLFDVLSVRYEGGARSAVDEPVIYWIEHQTGTIWKLEFSELRGEDIWRWTVELDQSAENAPPPSWAMAPTKMATKEDTRLVGGQAPEVIGRTLNGAPFNLSRLRGNVVVLDFWSTNCGFCSEEMADLEQLKSDLDGQGVEIYSVSEQDPQLARRWLEERKRTLPAVFVTGDVTFKAYRVDSFPTVVLIDRDGKVVRQWVEFAGGPAIRRAIESLKKR